MKRLFTVLILLAIMSLFGCSTGGSSESSQSQTSYKDLKSMVIDILKTEDAQKALQESSSSMSGYSAKGASMLSVMDQEEVRVAVKDVISSPDYDKVIKKLMTDTRFAGEFSKAVNEKNKDLHKELIKDPQYQKELISAFESDEMKKLILGVVKGSEYRKELMSLMQDSLKNPLFRMELLDLMKTAVSDELSVKSEQSGGGESGGSGSGGGESKGEGESGGGGGES